MIAVYNSVYGFQSFDNGHLREAIKMAYHFQRLGYHEGIITNTTVFTDTVHYHFGLRSGAYTTDIYDEDISVRLFNILMRRYCQTIAQAVILGANINAGIVNPWKIRNFGKKTLNELHNFSRLHVCDMTINRKIYDDRYFLDYVMEG